MRVLTIMEHKSLNFHCTFGTLSFFRPKLFLTVEPTQLPPRKRPRRPWMHLKIILSTGANPNSGGAGPQGGYEGMVGVALGLHDVSRKPAFHAAPVAVGGGHCAGRAWPREWEEGVDWGYACTFFKCECVCLHWLSWSRILISDLASIDSIEPLWTMGCGGRQHPGGGAE